MAGTTLGDLFSRKFYKGVRERGRIMDPNAENMTVALDTSAPDASAKGISHNSAKFRISQTATAQVISGDDVVNEDPECS
jgi:hypothetical protein